MKILALIFCTSFLFTSAFAQEDSREEIEIFTDMEEATDFDEYETYFWSVDGKIGEDTWISMNTLKAAMIQDALEYKFDAEQYEMNPENPDIIISYHVFEDGYNVENYTPNPPFEFRYRENKAKLEKITPGTLIVSIFSPEKGKVIWEGYATNVVEENNSLRENQKDIRYSVSELIDQFEGDIAMEQAGTY
jgi:hypothetical protein